LQRQGSRQALDVDQAQVPSSTFNVAEIGAVNAGLVCQILLRQSQFLAPRFDGVTEPFANIGFAAFFIAATVAACRLYVYRR